MAKKKDKKKVKEIVSSINKIIPLLKDKHLKKLDKTIINEKRNRSTNQNINQSTESL